MTSFEIFSNIPGKQSRHQDKSREGSYRQRIPLDNYINLTFTSFMKFKPTTIDPEKHPRFKNLRYQYQHGHMSRREFLRFSALLGISMATASPLLWQLATPGDARGAVYGDKLRIAGQFRELGRPDAMMSISSCQILRQVAEHLTYTDPANITHPYLLSRWEVSEDLSTWSLYLKKNIFFNNGQALTSDDVVFTFEQWLKPSLDTPMKSILGDYLSSSGIEKINTHQVVLHLDRPEIALPEHLFQPSAMILNHRTFEGDFMSVPHGTGPFRIESFEKNVRCLLKRRYDYWQPGLPFLNEIEFLDLGRSLSSRINALRSGTVDLIDLSDIGSSEAFSTLKNDRKIHLIPVPSARTNVLRMRSDKAPWTDHRVRKALKLCQHREKIRHLVQMGEGEIGSDVHVCPSHPEYCPQNPPKFDPRRAKSLLEEAGYGKGLDAQLAYAKSRPDIRTHAHVLQNDAARAGFRIQLQEIPFHDYQRKHMQFDLAITPWAHYPLGITALKLATQVSETGRSGPWNDTRWVDVEFNHLLQQACQTLDVPERKKIFCKLQEIQMQRGAVGISYWQNSWVAHQKRVQNVQPHPMDYLLLNNVWLKPTS